MQQPQFLQRILEPPSYGFADADGGPVYPTPKALFAEFFSRLNVFRDRKNWLTAWSWFTASLLAIPFVIFLTHYFSWKLALAGFVYSMICLGSHGTIYLHRYGTHRGYKFRNAFWIWVCRNLVLKIIPEETYIVSHHVHHRYSEQPGDPYNVHGGFLYCFLADANHQAIARNMTPEDYDRVTKLLSHTSVKPNTYAQYQRWGTVCSPLRTIFHFAVNWAFWYATFYAIGGNALATALFGAAGFWAFGVRTFNYEGHGKGKDRRRVGIDFNREDFSVNQIWPGYVAGEWHNNHHLFPNGARCGFFAYQLDIPWIAISTWYRLGIVSSLKDDKKEFFARYANPYRESLRKSVALAPQATEAAVPQA